MYKAQRKKSINTKGRYQEPSILNSQDIKTLKYQQNREFYNSSFSKTINPRNQKYAPKPPPLHQQYQIYLKLEQFKNNPQSKFLDRLVEMSAENKFQKKPIQYAKLSQLNQRNHSLQYKTMLKMDVGIKKREVEVQKFTSVKPIGTQFNNFMYSDKHSVINAYVKTTPICQQLKATIKKTQQKKGQQKLKKMMGFKQKQQKRYVNKQQTSIKQQNKQISVDEYLNQQFQNQSQSIHQSIVQSKSIRQIGIQQEILGISDSRHKMEIKQEILGISDSKPRMEIKQEILGISDSKPRMEIKQEISNNYGDQNFESISQQILVSSRKNQRHPHFLQNKINQNNELDKSTKRKNQSKHYNKKKDESISKIQISSSLEKKNQKLNQHFLLQSKLAQQKRQMEKKTMDVNKLLKNAKNLKRAKMSATFHEDVQHLIRTSPIGDKLLSLTSFSQSPSLLMNKIISEVLSHITKLQEQMFTKKSIDLLSKAYQEKMQMLLNKQEYILNLDMQRRLSQKNQIIANLLNKGNGYNRIMKVITGKDQNNIQTTTSIQNIKNIPAKPQPDYKKPKQPIVIEQKDFHYEQLDQDNVSWQQSIDIWDNFTDQQKKKIQQKQSDQVLKFLTGIIMGQLQQDLYPQKADIKVQLKQKQIESSLPKLNQYKEQKSQVSFGQSKLSRKDLEQQIGSIDEQFSFGQKSSNYWKQPKEQIGAQRNQKYIQQNSRLLQKWKIRLKNKDPSQFMLKLLRKCKQNEQNQYIGNKIYNVKFDNQLNIIENKQMNKKQLNEELNLQRALQQIVIKQMLNIITNNKQIGLIRNQQNKIIDQVQSKYYRIIDQSGIKLLQFLEKTVPINCNQNNKARNFDQIYKFSKKNKVPKEDFDESESLSYQMFDNGQKVKENMSTQVSNKLINEAALQMLKFKKKSR